MTVSQHSKIQGKISELKDCADGLTVIMRHAWRNGCEPPAGDILMLVAGARGACEDIAALLTTDEAHASVHWPRSRV